MCEVWFTKLGARNWRGRAKFNMRSLARKISERKVWREVSAARENLSGGNGPLQNSTSRSSARSLDRKGGWCHSNGSLPLLRRGSRRMTANGWTSSLQWRPGATRICVLAAGVGGRWRSEISSFSTLSFVGEAVARLQRCAAQRRGIRVGLRRWLSSGRCAAQRRGIRGGLRRWLSSGRSAALSWRCILLIQQLGNFGLASFAAKIFHADPFAQQLCFALDVLHQSRAILLLADGCGQGCNEQLDPFFP